MLFKLLKAPLAAPMGGFGFILRQVVTMAERELMDVDRIHQDLLLLNMRLEEGELTQEEFAAQEAETMVRLRVARELRKQRMGY